MFASTPSLAPTTPSPEQPLSTVDFVVFDTETTGLGWAERLVELGAVRFRGGAVTDRFRALVKPPRRIPEEVTRLHGITDEAVRECPDARTVLPRFARFIDGAVLLAHFAEFDQGILAAEFARAGLSAPDNPLYCTLNLARRVIPEAPRHGLSSIARFLSLPTVPSHRALPDAETARQLFEVCLARLGPDATLASLDPIAGRDGAPYSLRGCVLPLGALPHRLRELQRAVRRCETVRVTLQGANGRVTAPLVPRGVFVKGSEALVDFADPTQGFEETSVPLEQVVSVRPLRRA